MDLVQEFEILKQNQERTDAQIRALVATSETTQRQLQSLITETQGLLALYKDLQSVGRMGARTQSFLLWVAKWPVIGAGCYAVFKFFLDGQP